MLSHLLSQRFAACTALAVVLIIANGMLITRPRRYSIVDSPSLAGLSHALPDLTALLLYATVLFVLANRLFGHYDAK